MTTTSTASTVPIPVGAVCVEPWYHLDQPCGAPPSNGEPGSVRYFTGSEWTVQRDDPQNAIQVQLGGNQYADDGRVERFIVLDGDPLTPAQAGELAPCCGRPLTKPR
jgi:hypothetical protein